MQPLKVKKKNFKIERDGNKNMFENPKYVFFLVFFLAITTRERIVLKERENKESADKCVFFMCMLKPTTSAWFYRT